MLQLSVTALFYLEDGRRIHPQRKEEGGGVCHCVSARGSERETESAWLLLLYVFFPLGLPYANWAQPGVLIYLKSSFWFLDPSLTFLCSIFAGFPLLCLFSSVQFSRSVVSDSLRPHESQHTRPLCPSPTPGVHRDSRPSSQ